MTTAFNIFARKAVREYRIPFEISGDVPNAETVEAIQEVKRMKANPNLGKTYSDVDQMMGEPLPEKNRDHQLSGDYAGCLECHITPDWLRIYEVDGDDLILYLLGSALTVIYFEKQISSLVR